MHTGQVICSYAQLLVRTRTRLTRTLSRKVIRHAKDATPRFNRVEVLWPDHDLRVIGPGHFSVGHVLGLVHLCPVLAFGLVVLGLALHNACTCRAACRLGVDGAKWQGGDDDRRVAVARAGYLDVAAEEDALDFNTSLVANACRTAAAARRRSKGTEAALNLHALRTRSGVRKRWCQQTRSSMKQDERQVKQQQDEKARGSAHIGTTKHHIATASNVGGADDCCIAAAAAGDESVHAAPAHGSCHARR